MGMSEYKPDGKCGTCRHVHYVSGGGFHEPPYCDQECGVEDDLITVESLLHNIDEGYGDAAEWGVSRPCPLFLPLGECEAHGKLETGEFGCPDCDEEAAEAEAAYLEEEAREMAELRKAGAL